MYLVGLTLIALLTFGIWRRWRWVQHHLVDHVYRFMLRYWDKILVGTSLACLLITGVLILAGAQGASEVSFVLTVLFGLVSLLGLGISAVVLHTIRDQIPHHSEVAAGIGRVIDKASSRVTILAENPGVLQALDWESCQRWSMKLSDWLRRDSGRRVIFIHLERQRLVERLTLWSRKGGAELLREFKSQLLTLCGFCYRSNPRAEYVPLRLKSFPYFMVLADDDEAAMFCRSEIRDDIEKSVVRGFTTLDPYLVRALRMALLTTVAFEGVAFRKSGGGKWLSEREILAAGKLSDDLLGATVAELDPGAWEARPLRELGKEEVVQFMTDVLGEAAAELTWLADTTPAVAAPPAAASAPGVTLPAMADVTKQDGK